MKLQRSFYLQEDVVKISQDLLGKVVVTNFNGRQTSGIINETEAYAGISDKASHAWNNRRTARTEIMYKTGGIAYVYLCYGVHSLFNVVTNHQEIPHAVLVRGIIPLDGKEIMASRTNKEKIIMKDGVGPGRLSKLLGIHYSHSGLDLCGDRVWIEDRGIKVEAKDMITCKRVGIDYAREDAHLPYRFIYEAK